MRGKIPARIVPKPAALPNNPKPQCNCADKDGTNCATSGSSSNQVTQPRYVSGNPPKFPDESTRTQVAGSVLVALTVGENGRPTDVWVARPLGRGLDEEAAKSVLSYVFKPAKCHDKPIPAFLYIDVSFKVY